MWPAESMFQILNDILLFMVPNAVFYSLCHSGSMIMISDLCRYYMRSSSKKKLNKLSHLFSARREEHILKGEMYSDFQQVFQTMENILIPTMIFFF